MNTNKIDVKEVLKKKSPVLAKIPFLVSWLRTVVHEQELNDFLSKHGHLQNAEFANASLDYLNTKIQVTTKVPLSPQGRYMFVANHPLGGLDGMALIKVMSEIFGKIKFPVNDILFVIENLHDIFLPINKHGNQSREAVQKINEAYASDAQILMFPAGLVSRKIEGKIVDLEWQKHFITKAIEYQRDIVPVYIDGKNSQRFYQIARWRKWFGLPNIEMLLLPDELFRQRDKTIKINMGEPISYVHLKNLPAKIWADDIKSRVYDLA